MFNWFKPKEVLHVVEVEKTPYVPKADEETRRSVVSLKIHPGFIYLRAKLAFQRAVIKQQLECQRHGDLREVDSLQAGLYWADWLDNQIKLYTQAESNHKTDRLGYDDEIDAFKRVHAQLEAVGGATQ